MIDIPKAHELRETLKAMPLDTFCASAEQLEYQIDPYKRRLITADIDITQTKHNTIYDESIELASKALIYLDEISTRIFAIPPNAPISENLRTILNTHRELTEELIPSKDSTREVSFTRAIFNRFWCQLGISYVPGPTPKHVKLVEASAVNPLTTPSQFATLYETLAICSHLDRNRACKNDMWVNNIIRIVEDNSLTPLENETKDILTQNGKLFHLIACREHYRYDLMDDIELAQTVIPLTDMTDNPVKAISLAIQTYRKLELSKRLGAYIRRLKALEVRDFFEGGITARVLDLTNLLFDFPGAIQNYQTDTCWYLANILIPILETNPYILSKIDTFTPENVTAQRLLTLSYITEWILHHPSLFAHYPYRIQEIKKFYTKVVSEAIPSLLAKTPIDKTSLLFLQYSIEAMATMPIFKDKKNILDVTTLQISTAIK